MTTIGQPGNEANEKQCGKCGRNLPLDCFPCTVMGVSHSPCCQCLKQPLPENCRPPKTVRVRVAVAVSVNGDWHSVSRDPGVPLPINDVRYYLTADLPIPEPQEVEAEVEGG